MAAKYIGWKGEKYSASQIQNEIDDLIKQLNDPTLKYPKLSEDLDWLVDFINQSHKVGYGLLDTEIIARIERAEGFLNNYIKVYSDLEKLIGNIQDSNVDTEQKQLLIVNINNGKSPFLEQVEKHKRILDEQKKFKALKNTIERRRDKITKLLEELSKLSIYGADADKGEKLIEELNEFVKQMPANQAKKIFEAANEIELLKLRLVKSSEEKDESYYLEMTKQMDAIIADVKESLTLQSKPKKDIGDLDPQRLAALQLYMAVNIAVSAGGEEEQSELQALYKDLYDGISDVDYIKQFIDAIKSSDVIERLYEVCTKYTKGDEIDEGYYEAIERLNIPGLKMALDNQKKAYHNAREADARAIDYFCKNLDELASSGRLRGVIQLLDEEILLKKPQEGTIVIGEQKIKVKQLAKNTDTPVYRIEIPQEEGKVITAILRTGAAKYSRTHQFSPEQMAAIQKHITKQYGKSITYTGLSGDKRVIEISEFCKSGDLQGKSKMLQGKPVEDRIKMGLKYFENMREMVKDFNDVGIYFPDIKLGNFLINDDDHLVVDDTKTIITLSRDADPTKVRNKGIIPTPMYWPDALMKGETLDLIKLQNYLIGVSIYELVTGTLPEKDKATGVHQFDFNHAVFKGKDGQALLLHISALTGVKTEDELLETALKQLKQTQDEQNREELESVLDEKQKTREFAEIDLDSLQAAKPDRAEKLKAGREAARLPRELPKEKQKIEFGRVRRARLAGGQPQAKTDDKKAEVQTSSKQADERGFIRVMQEIVETERTFLHNLSTFVSVFEASSQYLDVLDQEKLLAFLEPFEKLAKNDKLKALSESRTPAEIAKNLTAVLKDFETEAQFKQAISSSKNGEFDDFLTKIQTSHPLLFNSILGMYKSKAPKGGDIPSFYAVTSNPFQRVGRYVILAREASTSISKLSQTAERKALEVQLKEAKEYAEQLGQHINAYIGSHELLIDLYNDLKQIIQKELEQVIEKKSNQRESPKKWTILKAIDDIKILGYTTDESSAKLLEKLKAIVNGIASPKLTEKLLQIIDDHEFSQRAVTMQKSPPRDALPPLEAPIPPPPRDEPPPLPKRDALPPRDAPPPPPPRDEPPPLPKRDALPPRDAPPPPPPQDAPPPLPPRAALPPQDASPHQDSKPTFVLPKISEEELKAELKHVDQELQKANLAAAELLADKAKPVVHLPEEPELASPFKANTEVVLEAATKQPVSSTNQTVNPYLHKREHTFYGLTHREKYGRDVLDNKEYLNKLKQDVEYVKKAATNTGDREYILSLEEELKHAKNLFVLLKPELERKANVPDQEKADINRTRLAVLKECQQLVDHLLKEISYLKKSKLQEFRVQADTVTSCTPAEAKKSVDEFLKRPPARASTPPVKQKQSLPLKIPVKTDKTQIEKLEASVSPRTSVMTLVEHGKHRVFIKEEKHERLNSQLFKSKTSNHLIHSDIFKSMVKAINNARSDTSIGNRIKISGASKDQLKSMALYCAFLNARGGHSIHLEVPPSTANLVTAKDYSDKFDLVNDALKELIKQGYDIPYFATKQEIEAQAKAAHRSDKVGSKAQAAADQLPKPPVPKADKPKGS